MKNGIIIGAGKTLRKLLFRWGSLGGMALIALTLSAQAQPSKVYDVDVSGYTLYTDPNHTDRQIKLGGFSGLFPVPGDRSRTMFYTVTDRGPTQDFVVETPTKTNTHKVLPCYELAPMIVKVQLLRQGKARVLEVIPLKRETAPGTFEWILGHANGVEKAPETLKDPYFTALKFDPDGLDPEGITMDDHGFFWICEEYRPSMAMIAPDGTVLLRLVPKGCVSGKETIPTHDILPAVLTNRVNNRGMEGITYAPNGCLYGIMQRPLANPTKADSEASCNLRIVEVNLTSFFLHGCEPLVRQFIYQVELPANAKTYASDIFALSSDIMLVPERKTDQLYAIDISKATDITPFENEDGTLIRPIKSEHGTHIDTTIEQLNAKQLAKLHIRTVKKAVILPSLIALHPELAKCEGISVVGKTIVLTYDNDFNLGDFGEVLTPTPTLPLPPGSIVLKSPDVYPALITTPLPKKVHFNK